MQLTRTDLYIGIFFFVLVFLDMGYQISSKLNLFPILAIIAIFIIFLIWAIILTYNLATLAIDYAYPDELYNQSGARQKRLYRSIVLVITILFSFFGTVVLIDRTTELFMNLISWTVTCLIINFYLLRVALLVLGPDENPYFLYQQ